MLLRKGHGTEPVLCGQELVEVGLGWSSRRGKQDGFFGLEEAFHYESGCLFGSEVVRKVQSEPCRRDLGAEEPLRRLILLNSAVCYNVTRDLLRDLLLFPQAGLDDYLSQRRRQFCNTV